MFNKSLKFFSVIGFTILMLSVFIMPAKAQVPDILDINFEYDPLFNNANFLPGDEVTRFVEVTNKNTENSYTIATRADNVTNSDGLGDAMDLTIFNNNNPGDVYYTGTLTDFFNAGVIELSELAPGNTIKYDYRIYFQDIAGNDYQNKTLSFDIIVGDGDSETIGEQQEGGDGDGDGDGGGGGGGGGGYTHSGLIIFNENIPLVGDTYATITWTTNNPATSRVIYDTISHPDLTGQSGPNYGYAFSNTEDTAMIVGHSMEITGLTSGTIYYFRPVSHASPEKTGIELTFTTQAEGDEEKEFPLISPTETTTEGIAQGPSGLVVGPGATIPTGGEGEPVGEDLIPEDILTPEEVAETEDETNNFLANISGLFGGISSCLILSLFLTLLLILYLMYRRRKEKRDKNNGVYKKKKYYWDLIGIFIIFIILMFLLKCYFLLIPIIITIAYWLYYYFRKDSSL